MLSMRFIWIAGIVSACVACGGNGKDDDGGDDGGSASLGLCANDADQAAFDALAADGGVSGPEAVSGAATDCGLQSCGGALGTLVVIDNPANREALSTCVASCLVEDADLTSGCAGCYGDVTACSAGGCPACISDSASPECRDCVDTECLPAFGNCI